MSAVGLFIYQSLDAIDGKQARRTNSSSPLGELFDHGCDAVSTGGARISAWEKSLLSFFIQVCTWYFILSVCLFVFYLQSLFPWEHASHVELDYTPTGYSSAVSSGCSCSSAPTGRPMCPGPSTLACKSFQSILAAAGGCFNDQASAPLPRPTHFHHVTSLCRVDVTEVQIAITIMYLMSAFGGVSLWQAAVMDCYIFNTAKYGHTHTSTNKCSHKHTYSNTFMHPECLVHAELIILLAFSCPSSLWNRICVLTFTLCYLWRLDLTSHEGGEKVNMGSWRHGNRSSIRHDLASEADDVTCIVFCFISLFFCYSIFFFPLLCPSITLGMPAASK